MPAREVSQKIGSLSYDWSSMIAEAHRLINDLEVGVASLNSIASMLAIPSKYQTKEQVMQGALMAANDGANKLRQAIQKLRSFMTV